jgi:CheY-like chemotaxis protein
VVYLPIGGSEKGAQPRDPETAAARSRNVPSRTSAETAASDGSRVLVVDDSTDIAETMAGVLELKGHEVRIAVSGREALDTASTFRPTAILLDIGMPDLDGYAGAERLRKLPGLKDSLFVAVSGYGAPEYRAKAKEAGFDFYLVKPVDYAKLDEVLRHPVGKNRPDQRPTH